MAGDVTDPTVLAAAFGPGSGAAVTYLPLPPAVFSPAIQALAPIGVGQGSRILVEKPFGTDLPSALALNRLPHRHFGEEAGFRLGHFHTEWRA